jgi:hypothetical protein
LRLWHSAFNPVDANDLLAWIHLEPSMLEADGVPMRVKQRLMLQFGEFRI